MNWFSFLQFTIFISELDDQILGSDPLLSVDDIITRLQRLTPTTSTSTPLYDSALLASSSHGRGYRRGGFSGLDHERDSPLVHDTAPTVLKQSYRRQAWLKHGKPIWFNQSFKEVETPGMFI